jgi:hypothetical protein
MYLSASMPGIEVPERGLLARWRRRKPYLFSPSEIQRLLDGASRLKPEGTLWPHTVATIIGLVASTGLRSKEPLKLKLADVQLDSDPPRLLIREAKFHKSRIVLGTIAASAFEAVKSLGEYGTRVKDAELRTGLTAKEVGQFGFAARAVGQDISIVERLMRGLSQAADDNSREGEKARATLRGMGIDFHTATGEMKPTSEILTELSEGLNKLPEGLQRDAVAMDLFKKVGVEAIPFMTELNENLRVAHEQGFGPTEEDIRRFAEYQREVTVLETKWDALVRKFKEGLVVTVTWVGILPLLGLLAGETGPAHRRGCRR